MNDIKTPAFFSGGNATFTVSNPTGEHYTFKIRKPKETTPYFVSLLSGPDNESDYTYLGVYNPDKQEIKLTAKSRFTPDSKPYRVIQWAVRHVNNLPPGYAIQHNGKCCRCGRTLTVPESIETGIGPECAKKGF